MTRTDFPTAALASHNASNSRRDITTASRPKSKPARKNPRRTCPVFHYERRCWFFLHRIDQAHHRGHEVTQGKPVRLPACSSLPPRNQPPSTLRFRRTRWSSV